MWYSGNILQKDGLIKPSLLHEQFVPSTEEILSLRNRDTLSWFKKNIYTYPFKTACVHGGLIIQFHTAQYSCSFFFQGKMASKWHSDVAEVRFCSEAPLLIPRKWQLLSFLCFKEGVRESDQINFSHFRVLCKLWVNVEKNRHVHFLLGI